MDTFAALNPEERREYFVAVAGELGLPLTIIEKDFWACWILKELFGLPQIGSWLIFKGGTSLSKAYNYIKRFSEDIDLSIDRTALQLGETSDPKVGRSNKSNQQKVDLIAERCRQWIVETLQPRLYQAIQTKLTETGQWSLQIDEGDKNGQTLLYEYPHAAHEREPTYIENRVKIEIGARGEHGPSEMRPVTPYVAEVFPKVFQNAGSPIKVLSAQRTFWEKATILHREYHRSSESTMPTRFSRHYYDFDQLIDAGVAKEAMQDTDLLARVVAHKKLYFPQPWAKYDEAKPGTLRIAPSDHRMKELHSDFAGMHDMFFGDAPDFDAMIDRLRRWEEKFNAPGA